MPHLPPHRHPTCCWLRSRARNAHSRLPLGQASSSGREPYQAPHPSRPTLVLETGDGPQLFKASMELHDSHPRLLPPWAQPGNSLYLGCVPTWVRVPPGCGALHCVPPWVRGPRAAWIESRATSSLHEGHQWGWVSPYEEAVGAPPRLLWTPQEAEPAERPTSPWTVVVCTARRQVNMLF